MTTVVRLKRPLNEDPSEVLLLNFKRAKNDNALDEDQSHTFLQFAGTLKNQEEDLSQHIKITKREAEESFKKHVPNITEKIRQQIKETSKANRIKVINYFRSGSEQEPSEASAKKPLTVVDAETFSDKSSDNLDYVYDLYYTCSDDIADIGWDHIVSIHPIGEDLVFDKLRENGEGSDIDYESEDSNAENFFRNDYPDEDDDSISEADMVRAVRKFNLDEDDDLSSDDGEEELVYGQHPSYKKDVSRYGKMYARFKKQNRKETTTNDLYYGDIDESQTESD